MTSEHKASRLPWFPGCTPVPTERHAREASSSGLAIITKDAIFAENDQLCGSVNAVRKVSPENAQKNPKKLLTPPLRLEIFAPHTE
jgi:hypothetical protein